ncbi:hypothetical protein L484_028051 [Morus notabilis]|uniref:Uncharacterized protein n=1 Tax=Morus notabilis TaxID=981085 RepID=W9SWB0_9ROSA|nr:hypothetical protein L484_028051 [Morus notabilis]
MEPDLAEINRDLTLSEIEAPVKLQPDLRKLKSKDEIEMKTNEPKWRKAEKEVRRQESIGGRTSRVTTAMGARVVTTMIGAPMVATAMGAPSRRRSSSETTATEVDLTSELYKLDDQFPDENVAVGFAEIDDNEPFSERERESRSAETLAYCNHDRRRTEKAKEIAGPTSRSGEESVTNRDCEGHPNDDVA